MPETLVLANALIRTLDPTRPLADSIAVQGERIVAVGKASEMPEGRRMDLGGRLVLPGFTDSHLHIMSWALNQQAVALDGARSLDEALGRIAARVAQTPPGQWLTGWGWNHNDWLEGFPTRHDLDRVAPDHPVLLTRKDGHMTWANTRALELAGITRDTPHPPGGEIRHDEGGEPNGLFAENANSLVRAVIPEPTAEQRRQALADAWPLFHQMGLVGGHEMGFADPLALWDDFSHLKAEGKLPWRITHYIHKHQLDALIERGLRSWDGDHRLRLGGLKIFMDGTLGSQTADMLDDFEGQPGNRGIVTTEFEELRDLVIRGAEAGISVAIHAIGDAANRKCLDVFSEWRAGIGNGSPLRQRIEHVQVLHPDDLGRLAELGVLASVQPIHCTSDMFIADKYWGERSRYAYAFCSLLSRGTRLAFGSDAPVETPDVMVGIHAAVTRQRANGYPEGGWQPQERLGVYEAVHGYTQGAAYASGEEAVKGSLTPGKLADLVVLDQDIFTIPPADILHTRVDATMLGGEWVYQDGL
ncbi:MAG: amidohydrolase [Anaerolineae bacterium]|nr:amidohydrolase [Anaerolineae bacterium]